MKKLGKIKLDYVFACGDAAGTSIGFRTHVLALKKASPQDFESDFDEYLTEACIREWEKQPKKKGPDLFSRCGVTIPETVTRYKKSVIDRDNPDSFEKVHSYFAIVRDYYDQADILMRNAAKTNVAALEVLQDADKFLKAAGGNMDARLIELPQDFSEAAE